MNVLVVESDSALSANIAKLVRGWGYRASTAATGRETLAMMQRKAFDLVLLDVSLPDMDVKELIVGLKELHPHIGVVTMAMESSGELEKEIRALGIVYYMFKPISEKSLKEILDHMFSRKYKGRNISKDSNQGI
jgi:DNA-binding response OmpR family regulator